MWIPVYKSWRLNERHYGALQGLNKAETAKRYGDEQVHLWRRSYDISPPALTKDDKRHPAHDPRYKDLGESDLPHTESLKDTVTRFLPYWREALAPYLQTGRRPIIAAHGNTLRALVKYLEGISDAKIAQLEIPTGIPLSRNWRHNTLNPNELYEERLYQPARRPPNASSFHKSQNRRYL